MDGVNIIGALLEADTALTDVVPAEQMKAGRLPDDAPLNSLLVRSVSEIERIKLVREGMVHITERVSVTVRAENYERMVEIDRLIRDACAGFVGDIAGAVRVAVLAAGRGPDLNGPNNSFERTRDFRVDFDTTT